jgi:excisionase family DNA binding protein
VERDDESVLTVEEAAKKLRIGRGTAYALARRWRETNGREGLPVIKLGRTLRVPRAAFDRHLLKLADPMSSETSGGGSNDDVAAHPGRTSSGHEAKRSRTGTGE